jgi:hypothetical protein
MGLRSTRATARHRVVSDGGTSNVSEPESLRKTHLTLGPRGLLSGYVRAALRTVYPEEGRDSIGGHRDINGDRRNSWGIHRRIEGPARLSGIPTLWG